MLLRRVVLLSLVVFALILVVLTSRLPDHHSNEIKRLMLQDGLPSPREPSLPLCLPADVSLAIDREHGSACRFTVHNHQMENVELLWFDGSQEKRYWIIDYNSSFVWEARREHTQRQRLGLGTDRASSSLVLPGGSVVCRRSLAATPPRTAAA